ncbi:hypothetical protein Forpe1208_v008834 [Fusarium oxysporum f. sp. rapae]|uniref:Uncharacterized protein n=1 Tax=Fusarium oxysporum f. sp. rapae TaxID=485398 RepID=A0A8J5P6M4_FUSOX|nr:hypothetical protein Forpe1208_v008834 [Fusarium oxysporum f. sp. rapae]
MMMTLIDYMVIAEHFPPDSEKFFLLRDLVKNTHTRAAHSQVIGAEFFLFRRGVAVVSHLSSSEIPEQESLISSRVAQGLIWWNAVISRLIIEQLKHYAYQYSSPHICVSIDDRPRP